MIRILKDTAEAFYVFGSMIYLGFVTPFLSDDIHRSS